MLNLLWSAFNALLIIGIGYLFFKAARLMQQHVGSGTALLFLAGLAVVSCGRTGNPSLPPKNLLPNIPANAPLGNAGATQHISLGGSNTLILLAQYHKHDGIIVPRGLVATVSGLTLGHHWEPAAGFLEQRGQQVRYQAVINHEWRLLSIPVYVSAGKLFEGLMPAAATP